MSGFFDTLGLFPVGEGLFPEVKVASFLTGTPTRVDVRDNAVITRTNMMTGP